jgi:hypothetical protein
MIKATGIVITVENDKIVQTVTMDGTSITIKVTDGNSNETSTITQKAASIAIDCKTFTLTADTITCSSKTDSKYESDKTLEISSTTDMTVKSEGTYTLTSTKAMSQSSSAALDIKSTGAMTLQSSAAVSIKGTTKVAVAGPTIAVNADMKLDLVAGGPATLEGAIANVKGNLVNLG